MRSINLRKLASLVGRKLIAGMAQVVKVNRREPGRPKSGMPDATAEITTPQRPASRAVGNPTEDQTSIASNRATGLQRRLGW
jgi:hypothetical protein